MALLKQTIKGRSVNTITVSGTESDIDDLQALLAGEVTEYDEKSTGGTSTALPTVFNTQKFSAKKDNRSVSVKLHHVKTSKQWGDIRSAGIGKLDCTWDGTSACDAMNLFYNNTKR